MLHAFPKRDCMPALFLFEINKLKCMELTAKRTVQDAMRHEVQAPHSIRHTMDHLTPL